MLGGPRSSPSGCRGASRCGVGAVGGAGASGWVAVAAVGVSGRFSSCGAGVGATVVAWESGGDAPLPGYGGGAHVGVRGTSRAPVAVSGGVFGRTPAASPPLAPAMAACARCEGMRRRVEARGVFGAGYGALRALPLYEALFASIVVCCCFVARVLLACLVAAVLRVALRCVLVLLRVWLFAGVCGLVWAGGKRCLGPVAAAGDKG